MPAPAPLGATGLAQPRQPSTASPCSRNMDGAGVHQGLLSLPLVTGTRLQEGHKAHRGAAGWPRQFWESHWAAKMAVPSGGVVVPQQRAELGELTTQRDVPLRCRQGSAGCRQSCRGAAGPQCFSALCYLLGLHLLQGITVHVPLGVTGHLAALACLGGKSRPTSWKGSTWLSHGQRGVLAVSGGQEKLSATTRQQVCKRAGRQHLRARGEAGGEGN